MASVFSRMFGGGRRWNAFNEPGSGNGSDLGTGAAGGQAGPTAGAVAPSATAAASPLDYAPLPRERIAGLRSLFTWNGWMGISIIQYLFVLAYCLVGIMVGLGVAQALVSGSAGYAVLYLILAPVWLLILTMILRLAAELAISVLMAPHMLAQNQKDLLRLLREQNARLLSSAEATHCPESELEAGQRSRPGSGSFRGIGSSGGGGVGGRRGGITAGDVDEEEEVGIRMASV